MQLSEDQVRALAPDAGSAAAGRKLGSPAQWQGLGRSEAALWGECRGSALYHTQVSLSELTTRCSCPSRKFPCKHALGLLFLAAAEPSLLPEAEPPEWVAEWLSKRSGAKREARPESSVAAPGAPATRAKRVGKREVSVRKWIESLDLWLSDLVRNGIASVETQPATYWERQAARMVDAQAPGVAARLRVMAAIPRSSPDWPRRLLDSLGRLALLTEAYHNMDALDPALREDVRQAIGWSLTQEEVLERGETVRDEWYVLGRRTTGDEKLRTRSTHMIGRDSSRHALVLEFAPAGRPFGEGTPLPGTHQQLDLTYWPGAYPVRALVREVRSEPSGIRGSLPGAVSLGEYLSQVARAMAAQPLRDSFPCALRDATPLRAGDGSWWMRDRDGCGVPLAGGEHWLLLAISGGAPVDIGGEWNGECLRPLGVLAGGAYYMLEEEH